MPIPKKSVMFRQVSAVRTLSVTRQNEGWVWFYKASILCDVFKSLGLTKYTSKKTEIFNAHFYDFFKGFTRWLIMRCKFPRLCISFLCPEQSPPQ